MNMTSLEFENLILEQLQQVVLEEKFDSNFRRTMATALAAISLLTNPASASVHHKVGKSHATKTVVDSDVSKLISTNSDFAMNIIAATVVDEARGEGSKGMQAVLNVIMNRGSNDVKKAARECLKQYQFSGWNKVNKSSIESVDKFIESKKLDAQFKKALNMVNDAEQKKLKDITGGAKHFLNTNLTKQTTGKLPNWYDKDKITNIIGNHTFLNLDKPTNTPPVKMNINELKSLIHEAINEISIAMDEEGVKNKVGERMRAILDAMISMNQIEYLKQIKYLYYALLELKKIKNKKNTFIDDAIKILKDMAYYNADNVVDTETIEQLANKLGLYLIKYETES
jgi:N-acetylmuramoyl-L-alanine amidase